MNAQAEINETEVWCELLLPCHPKSSKDKIIYECESVKTIVEQINNSDLADSGFGIPARVKKGSAFLDESLVPEGYYRVMFKAYLPKEFIDTHAFLNISIPDEKENG